jgi:hypothetical protein
VAVEKNPPPVLSYVFKFADQPLPTDSPQRSNIRFGQTQPFAIGAHPLIALDAAVEPLTPSIDFDPRMITHIHGFRVILGHPRQLFAGRRLGKGDKAASSD